jgi:diguanylate cyclase (GGDEF)-like protein
MSGASTRARRPAPSPERQRLELQVLVLQSAIAASYCLLVVSGLVPSSGEAWRWAVGWVASYHVFHAWYVLRRRTRDRPIAGVERVTPLLDITCITAGWVAVGNPSSALWGVFLYALVSYSRRIFGFRYVVLAVFVALNVLAGRLLIAVNGSGPAVDANLAIAVGLIGAVATVASAIGCASRDAEQRARRLAEVDSLTGISNRRIFLERLDEWAASPACHFAILMLDLDDFKRLNDEFGHLHGDSVLARVAAVFAGSLRADDMLARYGGEEFVIAMPDVTIDEATAVADRMRLAVCETTPTSVSIGCAARAPAEDAESVIRRADTMLLAAKRTGKNRTFTAEPLRRTA